MAVDRGAADAKGLGDRGDRVLPGREHLLRDLKLVGGHHRWRWTFWLILVAFLAGVLRVPVAILQLTGVLAAPGPSWYVVLQGLIGVVQFAIGLVMAAGYRRAGVWGTA